MIKSKEERYEFCFNGETENGIEYEMGGEIWYDPKVKRYKYSFTIVAPMEVYIDVEDNYGFINIQEAIEDINNYKVDENRILNEMYINN